MGHNCPRCLPSWLHMFVMGEPDHDLFDASPFSCQGDLVELEHILGVTVGHCELAHSGTEVESQGECCFQQSLLVTLEHCVHSL